MDLGMFRASDTNSEKTNFEQATDPHCLRLKSYKVRF